VRWCAFAILEHGQFPAAAFARSRAAYMASTARRSQHRRTHLPALGFEIPAGAKSLSERDHESGSYEEMLQSYESLLAQHAKQTVQV
jgi:hypothetical protein